MLDQIYKLFLQTPKITTDTRTPLKDSIFFCLKGENFDANEMVDLALEKGAEYVVTQNRKFVDHKRCFVVDDPLQTLQELALKHRILLQIPVIGITGTNGKTTTKELIATVLSQKYSVKATEGNLNNHIGVPLTLLSIDSSHEIAVVEMGANHPNEIAMLCQMVRPTYALVTNVGSAHLEGFKSFENIVTTKMALYDFVIQHGGTLFVNSQDQLLQDEVTKRLRENRMIQPVEKVNFNTEGDIPFKLTPYLQLTLLGQEVQTQLTGQYNLPNIAAATAIGTYFKVPDAEMIQAIQNYTPRNARSQIKKVGTNLVIADYYNANPTSIQAALANLDLIEYDSKVAIIGDMFELGEQSPEEHNHVIELVERYKIKSIFIGANFYRHKNARHQFFHNLSELNQHLQKHPIENSLLLIKGSRGIHLEDLILK